MLLLLLLFDLLLLLLFDLLLLSKAVLLLLLFFLLLLLLFDLLLLLLFDLLLLLKAVVLLLLFEKMAPLGMHSLCQVKQFLQNHISLLPALQRRQPHPFRLGQERPAKGHARPGVVQAGPEGDKVPGAPGALRPPSGGEGPHRAQAHLPGREVIQTS